MVGLCIVLSTERCGGDTARQRQRMPNTTNYHSQLGRQSQPAAPPQYRPVHVYSTISTQRLCPQGPVTSAGQRGLTSLIDDLPAKLFSRPKWPNSFVAERPGVFDSVSLYLFHHDSPSVDANAPSIESPSVATRKILELVYCAKRL